MRPLTMSAPKSEELLQIGEFARLAGTNLRTLRYYEELGLLNPAKRSEGGFRFYRRPQLDRMLAIQRLQSLGLSLEEIARTLVPQAPKSGAELLAGLRPLLDKQAELVESRIAQLRAELDDLELARAQLRSCLVCNREFSPRTCDPCQKTGEPLPPMLRALLP